MSGIVLVLPWESSLLKLHQLGRYPGQPWIYGCSSVTDSDTGASITPGLTVVKPTTRPTPSGDHLMDPAITLWQCGTMFQARLRVVLGRLLIKILWSTLYVEIQQSLADSNG